MLEKEKAEGIEGNMIFYFSGTGNSRYVAERVAEATGDTLISITKDEMYNNPKYVLQDEEKLGFVFPIYWWGMPSLVEEFIEKMNIQVKNDNYIYGISTYGLESHNGLKDLEKILLEKHICLHAVFEVKMVDNYVVGYDIADEKKQEKICKAAQETIEHIICDINNKKTIKITDLIGTTIKPFVHSFYKRTDHKNNFYTTDACTGCGLCVKNCPCKVIKMEQDRPMWKENCSFCLKCIHSCPARALQYGKGTEKRSRYLNHMRKE